MGCLPDVVEKARFRQHLPDLTTPRFQEAKSQSVYEYVKAFRAQKNPRWLYDLTQAWQELLEEPFIGVTNNGMSTQQKASEESLMYLLGEIQPHLFKEQNTDLPIANICDAATRVLEMSTPGEKSQLHYPLNAREWRCWSNPEFLLRPFGLRLEEVSRKLAELILQVVEASLSPEGYQKALGAMRVNQFLGQLVRLSSIMNEFSYNFLLFGEPSTTQAWGE